MTSGSPEQRRHQEAQFLPYCRLLPPRPSAKLLTRNNVSGAGDGNRTHVRSLGSSYSAIELRPLALNLVDHTRLSESRTQRVFFLIY